MGRANNMALEPVLKGGAGDVFDYAHASKLFVGDSYKLAPKYSFLYHVRFEPDKTLSYIQDNQLLLETGMLVKSVTLPKFSVDTKTMNAYNRPNLVQTKLKYDPVTITFHDDSYGVVLDFWRDYYTFYYRDSDYASNADDDPVIYHEDHKYTTNPKIKQNSWGYTLRAYSNARQLLKNIRIYSMSQGTFTEYMLINPMITGFQHGTHTAGENATMEHTMTISYESILYFNGRVTDSTVPGFCDIHYDKRPSPLTPGRSKYSNASATGPLISNRPGTSGPGGLSRPRIYGARSVLGPGGVIDTTDQIIGDIRGGNFKGALAKGYKSFLNNKNVNLRDLAKAEAKQAVIKGILTGTNPFSGVNVPVISNLGKSVGNAIKEGTEWAKDKFTIGGSNNGLNGKNSNQASLEKKPVQYGAIPGLQYNNDPGANGVMSNGSSVSKSSAGAIGGAASVFSAPGPAARPPLDTSSDVNSTVPPSENAGYPPAYYMRPANNAPAPESSNQQTTAPSNNSNYRVPGVF